MERDGVFGNHGVGYGENPLNRAGKDDEHTHHDRLDRCASCGTCSFVAARMRRRIVSCETPYAAATVRRGSFCSTTCCMISGQCSVGRPYVGCFGPGRRLLTIGGGLTSYAPSWASTSWTLRYSVPAGARKRYKIGDSVVETRRFRSVPRADPGCPSRPGSVSCSSHPASAHVRFSPLQRGQLQAPLFQQWVYCFPSSSLWFPPPRHQATCNSSPSSSSYLVGSGTNKQDRIW